MSDIIFTADDDLQFHLIQKAKLLCWKKYGMFQRIIRQWKEYTRYQHCRCDKLCSNFEAQMAGFLLLPITSDPLHIIALLSALGLVGRTSQVCHRSRSSKNGSGRTDDVTNHVVAARLWGFVDNFDASSCMVDRHFGLLFSVSEVIKVFFQLAIFGLNCLASTVVAFRFV